MFTGTLKLTSWMSSGFYRKSPEHLDAEGIQVLRSLVSKPYLALCPPQVAHAQCKACCTNGPFRQLTQQMGNDLSTWSKQCLLRSFQEVPALDHYPFDSKRCFFFRVQQNLVLSWMTRELPTLIQINQIESFEMSSSFYEGFEAVLWVGAQGVTINRIRNREGYTT